MGGEPGPDPDSLLFQLIRWFGLGTWVMFSPHFGGRVL